MSRSWILVGMMGAGKSSVGRALAELSQREFVDTDTLLQHRFGRPVGQIFDIYGEATFRDHEWSILKGLEPSETVIATGGGIVLRDENWIEMRRLGITIFLKAQAETLIQRLQESKKRRPLLEREDWRTHVTNLVAQRQPFYEKADLVVSVDEHGLETAPSSLLEMIRERGADWK